MKKATEKALKKMARDGYPEVAEALAEVTLLRDLLHKHDEFLRAYILGVDVDGGARKAIELRKNVSRYILDNLSDAYVND